MKAAGSWDKGRKATFPPASNVVARVVASRTFVEKGQKEAPLVQPCAGGEFTGWVEGNENARCECLSDRVNIVEK